MILKVGTKWLMLLFAIFPGFGSMAEATDARSVINRMAQEYEALNWFSGVVLVARGKEDPIIVASGYADQQKRLAVTPHTQFNIGSIQKNLTAVLVLQLCDQGKLSLDDTLSRFDLGFPEEISTQVHVRQLLDHTAGFSDLFTAEYRANVHQYDSIEKKLDLLRNQPLAFQPGTDRRYSNYGYIVLGAIIEKATGQSYQAVLQEQIISVINGHIASQPSMSKAVRAQPYHFNVHGRRHLVPEQEREHMSPDGGLHLSARELHGFYRLLFTTDQLLSAQSLQALKQLQNNTEQWVAFGGGNGISSAVEIDFPSDVWVVVLANTDHLVAEEMSARIRHWFATGEPTAARLPPSVFAYQFFARHGAERFQVKFSDEYSAAGYKQFIGKTLTDVARSLIKQGEASQSIFFFNYLVKRFPNAPEVYDGLAFGYASNGQLNKAQATFQAAKKLKPDFNSQFSPSNYGVD